MTDTNRTCADCGAILDPQFVGHACPAEARKSSASSVADDDPGHTVFVHLVDVETAVRKLCAEAEGMREEVRKLREVEAAALDVVQEWIDSSEPTHHGPRARLVEALERSRGE